MKINKIIDSHVHISMDAPLYENVKAFKWIMEKTNTERINFLALNAHHFFAATKLNNSKCLYLKSKFEPIGYAGYCIDYTKENTKEGFKKQIELAVNAGFDCWKIIEAKPNSQSFSGFKLDDDIYDSAFSYAESIKLPIIVHCADPVSMWDSDYKTGYLKKEEYQNQVYNVLAKHPNLVLTFAHFGFMADKPEFVKELFLKYPNVCLDNVPAPEEYFVISEKHDEWKEIFEKYSTRIIFGTDRGNHATLNYTKDEYFKLFPETVSYQKRLLLEDGPCDGRHPFPGIEELWGTTWYGLNISDEAYNNIVYNNFMRIYKEPRKINYELLKEIAEYEFSLDVKTNYKEEDYKELISYCNQKINK